MTPPKQILVTPRSVTSGGHRSLQRLRAAGYEIVFCTPGRQPEEDELRELLPGCIGYLAGVEPVTRRALEAADSLKIISRNGTGVDNVDLAATNARGIVVLRAEGANARGVAELAIAQLFALARGIITSDGALKRAEWERQAPGVELEGRTLGLAGCGRVGKLVAQMAWGLGMKILAFDPNPDSMFRPGAGFQYAPLDDVFAGADFLSLHCPPSADGRALLNASAISKLKVGVYIVNTARWDLIETDAILAGLENGLIGGMALDVFDTEPPTDARLALHPKVVATPHIGGYTRESIDRAMTMAVENMLAYLSRTDAGTVR